VGTGPVSASVAIAGKVAIVCVIQPQQWTSSDMVHNQLNFMHAPFTSTTRISNLRRLQPAEDVVVVDFGSLTQIAFNSSRIGIY
jgi:hypothetical protein